MDIKQLEKVSPKARSFFTEFYKVQSIYSRFDAACPSVSNKIINIINSISKEDKEEIIKVDQQLDNFFNLFKDTNKSYDYKLSRFFKDFYVNDKLTHYLKTEELKKIIKSSRPTNSLKCNKENSGY